MELDVLVNSLDTFQATVAALYAILCPISDLSQALQSPDLKLLDAQMQLNMLESKLNNLRSQTEFDKLVAPTPLVLQSSTTTDAPKQANEESTSSSSRPKRKRRLPAEFNDSVILHAMPIWSTEERHNTHLQINEYYEMLDIIKDQISNRFDNPAFGALVALQTGKMTPALQEFCTLHDQDIETVERQLDFTVQYIREKGGPECKLDLGELFRLTKVQRALHHIVDVALTLPVASSCAERAFSRLRLVKNHLRSTMSADRLQHILRISANKNTAVNIKLANMLEQFTKSERRILF